MSQTLSQFLPLLLMVVVFYFFFLRPQVNKQKAQNKFQDDMQKGDEVVTNSGLIGRINKIEDHVITLELDNKVYVRFTKASVSKEMTEAYKKLTTPK
jgi:preprotein translocase subunit YajC